MGSRRVSNLSLFLGGLECGDGLGALNIPYFDNSLSCYNQPYNYLTSSSLLTLITLNSAFKHIALYIMRINKPKKASNL